MAARSTFRDGCRPSRLITLLAIAACLVAALAPAAGAQQGTTTTPPTTSTVPATQAPGTEAPTTTAPPAHPEAAALADLAAQITKNKALLDQLNAQVADSTTKLAALKAQIDDTQQKIDANKAEITRLKTLMKARAAYMYQHSNTPEAASFDIQHVVDISAGKKYAESATHTDVLKVDDLSKLEGQLEDRKAQLDQQQAAAQEEHDRLVNAQQAIESLMTKQKKLLDEAGAVPVMGDAQLTADQVTAWFDSTRAKYQLSGSMPIGDLVKVYFEEGAAEHVRPELAFAQSIIETGSFGHALDNNYAGIGACDSCNGEPPFPTPRDGVRGQIQLLKAYADPTARGETLANPPSAVLWGPDPIAAAARFDTEYLKGKVPLWNMMGNGNWATDPGYAIKVLTVYFQMLAFAASH
jgi:peptidoglycan hydrolase CwlO-like protein